MNKQEKDFAEIDKSITHYLRKDYVAALGSAQGLRKELLSPCASGALAVLHSSSEEESRAVIQEVVDALWNEYKDETLLMSEHFLGASQNAHLFGSRSV